MHSRCSCAARLERLEQTVASLLAQVSAPPYRRAWTAADRRMLQAIAAAIGSAVFTARELCAYAQIDVTFDAALKQRGLLNPRQVGKFLRRAAAQGIVERCGDESAGALWRLTS